MEVLAGSFPPYGGLAREDENIIQESSKGTPEKRSYHWNLGKSVSLMGSAEKEKVYPKVVTTSLPNMRAIPKAIAHQSRSKVTCEVDGITCFPAKTSANAEDDEE